MNKGIIAAGVLAGTAGLAVGQTATIEITSSADVVNLGDTATLTATLSVTGGNITSVIGGLDGNEIGTAQNFNFSSAFSSDFNAFGFSLVAPTLAGADVVGFEGAADFGVSVDTIELGTWEVVADSEGFLAYDFTANFDAAEGFAVGSVTSIDATVINAANGGTGVQFVPAPGAAAIVGLGGLVATRRRRA